MTVDSLLIFYCPGTRGDFLAAVLTDRIDRCYFDFVANPRTTYLKMHSLEFRNPWNLATSEACIDQHRNTSIKINFAPSDYQLISTLAAAKSVPNCIDSEFLQSWTAKYQHLDAKFRYVVEFSSLFDCDFLADFYQQYNQRPMSARDQELAQYNIDLQFKHIANQEQTRTP